MLYQTNNPHGGDIYGGDVRLDFSANTNPFGTAPAVIRAVQDVLEHMHRYPDAYCRKLIAKIAEFETVSEKYVLCGNGAAELIYSYCEALRPKLALELAPTFSEYSLGLERVGGTMKRYPLLPEDGFLLDNRFLTFLEETKPEAVFLCNPNNPTGRTIPFDLLVKILHFCKENKIRLFLDECFCDLSDREETLKEFLADNPHLLLLKAFTKSYGMAGIRLGYCLTADQELLQRMSQTVQPWNVSSLAQAAGIAALEDTQFLRHTRSYIQEERQWLQGQLESLGYWVCPSEANYLFFRGSENLHRALKEQGIAIRNCDNYHGLGSGWYRIGVRLREENEELIRAMAALQ